VTMATKRPQLAKLTRPRLHKAVARERLFELLDEKREHPVVWIVGPPGAGKTTLAASYLEEATAPAIWYQIDPGDSDPATFFFYLKQAIESAAKRKGKPLPLLTPEYLPDLPGFARRFLRDGFARLPEDAILVFDNYHDIAADSALHTPFKAALAEVPPGSNVIVVSRSDPPPAFADAIVNQAISTVTWDDLRLTPEETTAIGASRGITDNAILRTLHEQSTGWMAGTTLMLEHLRGGKGLETLAQGEARDTVFNYFAGLIFDRAPDETKDVLLKTAFLPRVNASSAEAVTGNSNAIERIEELYRRRLFTDRAAGNDITYQYHALFHAFLRGQASARYSNEECRSIATLAATTLQNQGQTELALASYVEAEDWENSERMLIEVAPGLLSQGRWQTVSRWVSRLPVARRNENPWIAYWQGRSLAAVSPREARPILEIAFDSFSRQGSENGQLLAATAILESLFFEYEAFSIMDSWLKRVSDLMDAQAHARDPEQELWVQSTFMQAAVNRAPGHRRLRSAVTQVMKLLAKPLDVNLRVGAASMLLEYSNLPVDRSIVEAAKAIARPLLDSPDLTPYRAAFYWACEGYTAYLFGNYDEALLCFDKCEAIAAASNLEEALKIFVIMRGFCLRRVGHIDAADALVLRLEKYRSSDSAFFIATFDWFKALIAFDRGNRHSAVHEAMAAMSALDTCSDANTLVSVKMVCAYLLTDVARYTESAELLDDCNRYVTGTVFHSVLGAISLLKAWVAHNQADTAGRNELIRDALEKAQNEGSRARLRWFPKALETLIPVALEHGIETEMVTSLVREYKLAPPSPDIENWPWPVKVYALGRFELLVDGESPEYSRKVPKKVLALLKAIIAFGAQEVPEQRILDALWPEEDGDSARGSLSATLRRLRKLLANDDAVRQAGGNLSLDERICWVDAVAFENRLRDAGQTVEASEAAVVLYRGPFLAQDDAPWAMPTRERLRAKFIHGAGRLGASFESSGRYEDAIDLYLRGLDADNLVEPFYQGLMRCYDRLNRRTEAVSVFRRMRETLSITLGVPPSSTSQRLFETIRMN
jgi:LuxR family transcriptional regulator, maltose regulon positive regulatory protein